MNENKTKRRFYIIDAKFKRNKKKYILQCLMAAAAISIILLFMDFIFNDAVLVAFGATCFVVFTMPHQKTSNPRRIIGGYLVGIGIAVGMRFLEGIIFDHDIQRVVIIAGALAVALSIFMMSITNTEHPPAAGVALGIALDGYEPTGLLIILIAISILVAIKYVLRRWMIDLFE